MYYERRAILSEEGMRLTKCHSNSDLMLDSAGVSQTGERLKILGICWDSAQDVMRHEGVCCLSLSVVGTKPVLLSFLARMFDRVGFLVPFVLAGKVLFEQLLTPGLGWDDILSCDEEGVFHRWLPGMPLLQQLGLGRCFVAGGVCSSEVSDQLEPHVIGDASVKGYGCVVYVRYPRPDGGFIVTMARARVAPVKAVSLPRLELAVDSSHGEACALCSAAV